MGRPRWTAISWIFIHAAATGSPKIAPETSVDATTGDEGEKAKVSGLLGKVWKWHKAYLEVAFGLRVVIRILK